MQKNKQEKSPIKERILQYLELKGISKYAFYKDSGVSRGVLDQETGISEDNLARFLDYAQDISLTWLMTGKGEIFPTKTTENVRVLNTNKNPNTIPNKRKLQKTLVTDTAEMTVIPIVDISAAAGAGAYNIDDLTPENTLVLPPQMVRRGLHHCIKIKGDSMSPTLLDGGYIITRLLDRVEWGSIKDEHVYVVTTREGVTYIKRLRNRLHEFGFVVCTSDNPDKNAYRNFNLMEDEIHNIWYVEWYLSAKMPNIHATYYNQMQELRDDVDAVMQFLESQFKKPLKES